MTLAGLDHVSYFNEIGLFDFLKDLQKFFNKYNTLQNQHRRLRSARKDAPQGGGR
jgi:hypothetical protein